MSARICARWLVAANVSQVSRWIRGGVYMYTFSAAFSGQDGAARSYQSKKDCPHVCLLISRPLAAFALPELVCCIGALYCRFVGVFGYCLVIASTQCLLGLFIIS